MTTNPTPIADGGAEALRKRLASASPNDRAYEKPMSWADADRLLARLTSLAEDNAKLRERVEELEGLIGRIEPHVDAIVCYASTMGEHEPNRIAHEVRAVAGRTKNELAGEATAHPTHQEETGWMAELKGRTPSWSTLFAGDYDDHWTEDSTKAIRFARKVDAEAWIAWHGWTEAFASEHIWNDGREARAAILGEEKS